MGAHVIVLSTLLRSEALSLVGDHLSSATLLLHLVHCVTRQCFPAFDLNFEVQRWLDVSASGELTMLGLDSACVKQITYFPAGLLCASEGDWKTDGLTWTWERRTPG